MYSLLIHSFPKNLQFNSLGIRFLFLFALLLSITGIFIKEFSPLNNIRVFFFLSPGQHIMINYVVTFNMRYETFYGSFLFVSLALNSLFFFYTSFISLVLSLKIDSLHFHPTGIYFHSSVSVLLFYDSSLIGLNE